MSVGKLATALTVVFLVSLLILAAELLYLLFHRRRNHISGDHPHSSTKNFLHFFFCFKTQTRVEPSGPPTGNPDGSSPDDAVIDVFKLLEATGPSRVLCTIKEDDREDVESAGEMAAAERVSLKECLESEAAAVVVEDAKTVFSSPCDSPMFFTPVGSPARDGMWSEIVSPVKSGCDG